MEPTKVAHKALYVVSPLLARLMEVTTGSTANTEKAAAGGDIDELRREAERQEITMRMAERQAKVAQELALASRIESALEVEMEEFFDISGGGSVGVSSEGSTITAGLSGHGQKVTKRIFRFKGKTTDE